jgi:hypothetical protein
MPSFTVRLPLVSSGNGPDDQDSIAGACAASYATDGLEGLKAKTVCSRVKFGSFKPSGVNSASC